MAATSPGGVARVRFLLGHRAMHTIVIDPGHGGAAPVGRSSPIGVVGPGGTREKDVTLEVARRLRASLAPHADVRLTRGVDENRALAARRQTAADLGAAVFISLHANGDVGARGSQTWIHDRAGAASGALAARVQRALDALQPPGGGVRRAPMAVLDPRRLGAADGCLVELDDLTDRGGEARLGDPRALDAIAAALAAAIRAHLDAGSVGRLGGPLPAQFGGFAPLGMTYDAFQAWVTVDRASDHVTTTVAPVDLTLEQLFAIYPDFDAATASDRDRAEQYLALLNAAFRALGLDTVEARAVFLAHADGESGEFRQFVAQGDPPSLGVFKGRGPLQVTTKPSYVGALAYLAKQADAYRAEGRGALADTLTATWDAVVADPAAASEPTHAFLFSAAYQRMATKAIGYASGTDTEAALYRPGAALSFVTRGIANAWMMGGATTDPNGAKKQAAYARALAEIRRMPTTL